MKTYPKLIGAFLVLSIVPLLVNFFVGISLLNKTLNNFQEVAGKRLPGSIVLARMAEELYHIDNLLTQYNKRQDIKTKNELEEIVASLDAFKTMRHIYFEGEGEAEGKFVDQSVMKISRSIAEYILLLNKGASEEELQKVRQTLKDTLATFISVAKPTMEKETVESLKIVETTMDNILYTRKLLFVLGGVIIIFAIILSLVITKRFKQMSREIDDHRNNLESLIANRTAQLKEEIFERKRTEEERALLESRLYQSQKMEAIGTLAGGIAHDFNNILTPIVGYTELALRSLPPSDSSADSLREIKKATDRARNLVGQILTFSRKGEQTRQPIAPHVVIKETIKLLRSSIPTTIEIRESISSECGTILGDPTQLQQVVMNLCANAYQAMRGKSGVLGVGLKRIEISEEDRRVWAERMQPGPYVELEVSDTGIGMSKQTVEKIFEPYFTTKAKGEGTGLGLANVHGIVKSFGGHITVYSELGQGTTFHVYLPREEVVEQQDSKDTEKGPLPGGKERLLLVDDEKTITNMYSLMLQQLGYIVTTFNQSEEALKIFEENPDAFDVIVTDMTMPHMTGLVLSKKILKIRPDMPIILCTGFSELINAENAKALGIREFLMKPVNLSDLAYSIRRACGENIVD